MAATFPSERESHAAGQVLVGARSDGKAAAAAGGLRMMAAPPLSPSSDGSDDDEMTLGRRQNAAPFRATSWLEIWDFVGGASFRAFVADNGYKKSLFTFFDVGVVSSRDLKQA